MYGWTFRAYCIYGALKLRSLLSILVALLISASFTVNAAVFSWRILGGSGLSGFDSSITSTYHSSPSEACSSAQTKYVGSWTVTGSSVARVSDTSFNCYVKISSGSSNSQLQLSIGRYGDGCDAGQEYDGQTGQCVSPPGDAGTSCDGPEFAGMPAIYNSSGQCVRWDQADTASTCKSLASTGTTFTDIYVAFDGDGNPEKPQVEKLGCAVQVIDVANCKMPVPKCGQGICIEKYVSKCRVGVTFTGEVAGDGNGSGYPVADGSGSEGVCPDGVDCIPADEPVVEESKPCNYMANGQVVGCESSEFKGNPGEMNCGTVNGGPYTCTKKVPTSNGVNIKTDITSEPQADGTTKQTKQDVHTKTICSAPGSCVTQTTTNKTITIMDGNGNTLSQTGSCTGANCSAGKGQTGNCPAGETCDAEEEQQEFNGPQNDDVPGFSESLESFKAKVAGAPLIAGVTAIRMPTGGSCSIGSVNTMIGTISGDGVCQNSHWLDDLYYVFLAMGALGAVRIAMSA